MTGQTPQEIDETIQTLEGLYTEVRMVLGV